MLEVVVALAVLALTLGVVYETLGWSLRRTAVAQQKEIAWLHAQSILATIRAEAVQSAGLYTGTQEGESAGVKWRVEIRGRVADISESSAIVPFEVVVTVPWGPKRNEWIALKSIELARKAT